jgi:hypothetical protein
MKAAPDPVVIEEIFNQLWFKKGLQLCNFESYARVIPPLQKAYGDEAVAAALCRYRAQLRSQSRGYIRDLQRNAAWLRRESREKT